MSLQDLVMHSLCIKVWKAIRVITTILKGTTGRPSFWLPSIDVNLDPVGVYMDENPDILLVVTCLVLSGCQISEGM